MRKTKKILSILLACAMLMSLLSIGVFAAAGDRDNPINANDKWFGYGADCYLLNPTLAAGDTDGVWYQLTADANNKGILQLENRYKDVEYQVTAWVNGVEYKAYEDGTYYRPIATYPVAAGDVVTIQVVARDTTQGGTVYLNAKFITGAASISQMVTVKSAPAKLYVAAGKTVYFQDDSLNADFAAQYVNLKGDSVEDVKLYTVVSNANTGVITPQKAYADTDGDGVIETQLGGSEASAGAPAVKPAWAVENNSNEDRCYVLSVVDEAHECVFDDDNDMDCNTCGDARPGASACDHKYATKCDAACSLCGEIRTEIPHYPVGDYACNKTCCVCWADLTTANHVYSFALANTCDVCGESRDIEFPMEFSGASISEDVNGLAVRYDIQVDGMEMNGSQAVYDNATVAGMKLISMGAVAANNYDETQRMPTLDDVDNVYVLDIPAKYLFDLDKDEGIASYAIRITDIPDVHKDTTIAFMPYVILEDAEGVQHTLYVSAWGVTTSYNEEANF